MNPEDLDLPQPPEGILDPQIPWSYVRPQSPLWNTLKARLTGRPTNGEHYSSYVNITEAEADKLIENLKKDPRGYPSLDQESGTPVQWMERQQKYQEWLVEEYLEKPFRKKVDAKIEEADINRVVNQRRESKVKPTTPLIPTPTAPPPPEPEPAPDLIPDIPEETKVELIPIIPEPVAEPEPEKPKSTPLRDEDLTPPYRMPSNVMRSMTKYGMALDKIGNELSRQNFKLERSLGYLRRIDEDLDDAQFLLEQMSENYQEALDDIETEERKREARKQFFQKLTTPFTGKKQQTQPTTKLAEGGVSVLPSEGKVIPPGIYDNPTVGKLAPGTAVIPLNRNYGKEILNQYDNQQYNQALADVLAKPVSALLGAAVSVFGSILRSLGPLAGYFNVNLPKNIELISNILGLSRSEVIEMLGGPGVSGTEENTRDLKYFYKSWRIYMNNNRLFFPGAGGVFGGPPGLPSGEIAKDIGTISSEKDLRFVGGTNVGKLPAWIPFSKADTKKIGYVSGFGLRDGRPHSGIDLDGDPGIKIITPFAGTVFDLNRNWPIDGGGGYGNLIGIEHDQPKIFTYYGHLQDVAASLQIGSKVKAGEVIGTLGNTGRSTGPHLHWEVRTQKYGGQIDPVEWTHQNKPSFSGGGFLNTLGRVLPGTGTVMAPKSSGPKDIQGIRQTLAGYQNKLLGIPLGKPSFPKGNMGEYSQKENRRYYEKTGKYFIPTDFGPGYLPGIHGLYTPPNTKQQVRPQGAITSTNNQQLRNAIQNARDITNMPGGGAYKPLVESATRTSIKQQQYYDKLRDAMRDAGMKGADQNMDIYGNLKNKAKPKTISMTLPPTNSTPNIIPSSSKSDIAFVSIDMPTSFIMSSTQMRRIA